MTNREFINQLTNEEFADCLLHDDFLNMPCIEQDQGEQCEKCTKDKLKECIIYWLDKDMLDDWRNIDENN